MQNLNSNILCAVDIITTGPLPGFHDIVEISVVPMHCLTPDKTVMPFSMFLQPKRPENIAKMTNKYLREYARNAIDPYTAVSMFEHWYEKLQLKQYKRIIPLSYNWASKVGFLIDWFCSSDDGDPYYYDHFNKLEYRDLMCVANYWNDLAFCKSEHFPFTKQRLHFIAQKLGVPWVRPSTTLSRCFTMISAYNKLMELKLPSGIDLPFNFPMPIDYSVAEDEADEPDE